MRWEYCDGRCVEFIIYYEVYMIPAMYVYAFYRKNNENDVPGRLHKTHLRLIVVIMYSWNTDGSVLYQHY